MRIPLRECGKKLPTPPCPLRHTHCPARVTCCPASVLTPHSPGPLSRWRSGAPGQGSLVPVQGICLQIPREPLNHMAEPSPRVRCPVGAGACPLERVPVPIAPWELQARDRVSSFVCLEFDCLAPLLVPKPCFLNALLCQWEWACGARPALLPVARKRARWY